MSQTTERTILAWEATEIFAARLQLDLRGKSGCRAGHHVSDVDGQGDQQPRRRDLVVSCESLSASVLERTVSSIDQPNPASAGFAFLATPLVKKRCKDRLNVMITLACMRTRTFFVDSFNR